MDNFPKKRITPLKLHRYTSLPVALDILYQKRITLLSPETWEDRNDAYYLERYREERKFRSVLAICFSTKRETFHHWKIFSHGSAGVRIEFDKMKLLQAVNGKPGFRSDNVKYRLVRELQEEKPDIQDWPFLKRKPFEAEAEFRIVYETKKEALRSLDVPIDISAIKNVVLSPWLPQAIANSVIRIIKGIDNCGKLSVFPSTLLENAEWRSAID